MTPPSRLFARAPTYSIVLAEALRKSSDPAKKKITRFLKNKIRCFHILFNTLDLACGRLLASPTPNEPLASFLMLRI
jgi:hypothetical protein